MVDCRVHAVLVKVAALGLTPDRHLGQSLQQIRPHMERMVGSGGVKGGGEAVVIALLGWFFIPHQHLSIFPTFSDCMALLFLLFQKGKYGLNVCGEGGEYETFTLDCPLFKKKIVM